MSSDCQAFSDTTAYIANWIRMQPSVKEESLTDWLLFELSLKIPRIRYVAFTRHQEARKTGADWEWWFLTSGANFVFRVQAKRSKPKKDNYASIAHSNKHGLQIDKLLKDAIATNAIPMYVFYTNSNGSSGCPLASTASGAFSVGAQTIYNDFISPGKQHVSEAAVLGKAVPLDCFACCQKVVHASGVGTWVGGIFSQEINELAKAGHLSSGRHDVAPQHIQSLLDQRDGIPDWWEREFERVLPDTKALLVYDLRD